ncbi:hypothetical protein D3C76_1227420 [compost metagenome]
METRSRRSRRTLMTGIHRLIAVPVLQLFFNVRRQRHLAQPVEDFIKDAFILKADGSGPHLALFFNYRLKRRLPVFLLAKMQNSAFTQAFARFNQRLPTVLSQRLQKQKLRFSSGIRLMAI